MFARCGEKGAGMFKRFLRPDPARAAGASLYATCASAARKPYFYQELAVPDTVEGRFEIYALHVLLVIGRLRGEGERASAVSQALFDALLRGLDDGLREMGVGDLSVGKKMRKLGEALYGRARNLDQALELLPNADALQAFLARTTYAEVGEPPLADMIGWVSMTRDHLAAQVVDHLLDGRVTFLDPAAVGHGADVAGGGAR
jgi:cytochrome b pre-mRNA-processing protein 3